MIQFQRSDGNSGYKHTFRDDNGGYGFRFWDIGQGEIMNFTRGGTQADVRIPAYPTFAGGTVIIGTGSGELGLTSSTEKIKTHIKDLPDSGEDNPIWGLRPRRFRWNPEHVKNADDYNDRHPDGHGLAGLVTEEVHDVMPHATHDDGRAPEDGGRGGVIAWDERVVIAYLVDAVQYLRSELESERGGAGEPAEPLPADRGGDLRQDDGGSGLGPRPHPTA
jgi:hypothetical protein